MSLAVVDNLRVDVFEAPIDRQPWALLRTRDAAANPVVYTLPVNAAINE